MQRAITDWPKRLYEAVRSDYPDNPDGTRPVHTVGIGASGYFVGSDAARRFSIAPQFGGDRIPVTTRFSNGAGHPVERDHDLDVRGMATKFHLHDGTDADLIMITLPVFFAATPEDFVDFAGAGVPKPAKPQSWFGRMMARLQLRQPDPPTPQGETTSGVAGVVRFLNKRAHFGSRSGFVAATLLPTPTSYARAAYHALHTFNVTAPDGTVRAARFSWEPVAGLRPEHDDALPGDYLHVELGRRLERGPVRFVLRMVLAGQGDPVDDPTVLWDTTRERIVMGELVLDKLVDDQEADCERLSFNPTRVVAGLECSDDPILAARRGAYEYSCTLRGGTGCPITGNGVS